MLDLLEELPSSATGLGATEMRLLELIARGYAAHERRSFTGDGAAPSGVYSATGKSDPCSTGWRTVRAPAVAGLDDELRTLEMRRTDRDRDDALQTKPAVAHRTRQGDCRAQTEDFSRHNPIDRWWGGTEIDQRPPVALGSGPDRALTSCREPIFICDFRLERAWPSGSSLSRTLMDAPRFSLGASSGDDAPR